jgi:hypothetical protein
LPLALLGLLAAGVIAACKQSEGARCQVDADCEDGLVCNQGTNPPSCQREGGNNPIDAQVPDVTFDDASDATDAMPDT